MRAAVARHAKKKRAKPRQAKKLLTEQDKKRKAVVKQAEEYLSSAEEVRSCLASILTAIAQPPPPAQDTVSRDTMKGLLKHLTEADPPDAALDMLMSKAVRSKGADDAAPAGAAEAISKAAALALVARHVDYVMVQPEIDKIFDEFDENKNGFIDGEELQKFLEKMRPDDEISQGDKQHVMQECDTNNDGKLSRDEILPMCAEWQKVAPPTASSSPLPPRASSCRHRRLPACSAASSRAPQSTLTRPWRQVADACDEEEEAAAANKSKACAIL